GSNMSYFKEALKLRGIDAGYMRAPQLDLPEDEIAELKRKLDDLNAATRYA
ncbi:MAG: dihydrodipicolinate synthase family protein, partial [Paenibacillus sp.]|nr:dihydrodipicolinate synthase family protein [Paenibacillus sp.]